ncbi:bucentaur or craniofacial development protein [Rhizoctonia solani]|uniref:SWR1-complex protein 5 n=1 Tax=Rhizoctonia solani TaxID=456999 RepID=A0A8H8P4G6_9AGAM|nr:bucentaur or craniofacial development protein [Rhizoctonia solani]QRW23432.1 bucentaur or craniofacial development protein [Rhizoctonia solani]
MSKLPTLSSVILDSDEDDDDYVPGEQDSDSDSETGREAKKPRTEEALDTKNNKLLPDDAARDALWSSFLESTRAEPVGSNISTPKFEAKMVTIEKKYRFAGEDVIEKVVVAEDAPEAQEWCKHQATDDRGASSTTTPDISTPGSRNLTPSTSPLPLVEMKDSKMEIPSSAKPKPPTKPRKSLSGLAAAAKSKKLTTLDKSRLDWQSHLASATQEERDELERNRKAGGAGYLEKVDFLARVDQRKDGVFEDSKRKRR